MKNSIMASLSLLICLWVSGQNNMVAYQYWFDTASTSRITISVNPASTISLYNSPLSVSSLTPGQHLIYLRTQDAQNNWSAVTHRTFNIPDASVTYALQSIRYWTDVSSSVPSDIRIVNFSNPQLAIERNLIIDFCQSTVGNKKIYFQLMDNNGNWSSVEYRTSNIVSVGAPLPFTISMAGDTLFAPSYWGLQWYYSNGIPVSGNGVSFLQPLIPDSSYYAVISNQCGNTTSSDTLKYVYLNTDIEPMGKDVTVQIYPNPTRGNLTVKLSQVPNANTDFTVYNILGEIVQSTKLRDQTTSLRISQTTGMYFATIKSKDLSYTQKIFVE